MAENIQLILDVMLRPTLQCAFLYYSATLTRHYVIV